MATHSNTRLAAHHFLVGLGQTWVQPLSRHKTKSKSVLVQDGPQVNMPPKWRTFLQEKNSYLATNSKQLITAHLAQPNTSPTHHITVQPSLAHFGQFHGQFHLFKLGSPLDAPDSIMDMPAHLGVLLGKMLRFGGRFKSGVFLSQNYVVPLRSFHGHPPKNAP